MHLYHISLSRKHSSYETSLYPFVLFNNPDLIFIVSLLYPIPFHPTLSNSFSSHPIASFSTPSLFIPSYPTDQPNPFVETSRRLHEDAEQRAAQQRWLERQVENARHAQYTFQPAINPGTTAMFDKGVEHRPIHERIADIQRDQR